MKTTLKIKSGGKELEVENLRLTESLWEKFRGLMFRSKNKSPNLLFEFNNPTSIHSYFVFFKFLALWLDNENNVLDFKIVKPFSLYEKPQKNFSKLVELPLNKNNKEIINFIVGERFKKN